MLIKEIVPHEKRGTYQIYKISYEEYFKTFEYIDREKEIIKKFNLTKSQFKRILIESMNSALDETDI